MGRRRGRRYEHETHPAPVHRRERRGRRSGFARRCQRDARLPGKGGRPTIPPGLLGRPAVLGARCDGTAQHRVEQPARPDAGDGLPRRPGLSGTTRPTSARSCRSRAGTPRCSSSSPRSASGASSSSSRPRTSRELGRQPTAAEIRRYLDAAGLKAVGTHQFGLGNLDPATGNLTAAGETLFEFLATLGMDDDGLLGQPVADAEQQPGPGESGGEPPGRLGLAGGLREPRDRVPARSGSGAGPRTRTGSARSFRRAA